MQLMSRVLGSLVVGLVALLALAPAHAQRDSMTTSYTCGQYIEKRRASAMSDGMFANYAYGYISAYNFWGTKAQVKTPEGTTVLAYLDKYCADQPLRNVSQGVDALIGDIGGFKLPLDKP